MLWIAGCTTADSLCVLALLLCLDLTRNDPTERRAKMPIRMAAINTYHGRNASLLEQEGLEAPEAIFGIKRRDLSVGCRSFDITPVASSTPSNYRLLSARDKTTVARTKKMLHL